MHSHQKCLLILGGLDEFVPLTAAAKEHGIRAVVVDGNIGAPAKSIADAAYDADIRDTGKIAEIARREGADALTTAYSDLLLECAVRIADAAGLPFHLKPAQLPFYRDKYVINRTCEKLGIPTPKSFRLTDDFRDEDLSALRFPAVIKPLDMYGSRGLRIVHSVQEIRDNMDACLTASGRREFLAEEYNPDHEFNIQCWIRRGKIHVLGICDREKTPFIPGNVPFSTRNIYPSCLIGRVYAPALSVLETYTRFTGQTEGPLAMQFFWSPGRGIEVGEIAARFLGYEHELIRFASGLSIEELLIAGALIDSRVDALLSGCRPFGEKVSAVLYFHGRDGVIADMEAARQAARRPDVCLSQFFYKEGDRIGEPETQPYVARLDITAAVRAEADRASEEILKSVSILDAAGRELLYPNRLGDYSDVISNE